MANRWLQRPEVRGPVTAVAVAALVLGAWGTVNLSAQSLTYLANIPVGYNVTLDHELEVVANWTALNGHGGLSVFPIDQGPGWSPQAPLLETDRIEVEAQIETYVPGPTAAYYGTLDYLLSDQPTPFFLPNGTSESHTLASIFTQEANATGDKPWSGVFVVSALYGIPANTSLLSLPSGVAAEALGPGVWRVVGGPGATGSDDLGGAGSEALNLTGAVFEPASGSVAARAATVVSTWPAPLEAGETYNVGIECSADSDSGTVSASYTLVLDGELIGEGTLRMGSGGSTTIVGLLSGNVTAKETGRVDTTLVLTLTHLGSGTKVEVTGFEAEVP